MKARREIADYIKNRRTERARIRVSELLMPYSSGADDLMAELQSADLACDPLLMHLSSTSFHIWKLMVLIIVCVYRWSTLFERTILWRPWRSLNSTVTCYLLALECLSK